VADGVRCGI